MKRDKRDWTELDTVIRPVIDTSSEAPTRAEAAATRVSAAETQSGESPVVRKRRESREPCRQKAAHPTIRRAQLLSLAIGAVIVVAALLVGFFTGNRAARLTQSPTSSVSISSDPASRSIPQRGPPSRLTGERCPGRLPCADADARQEPHRASRASATFRSRRSSSSGRMMFASSPSRVLCTRRSAEASCTIPGTDDYYRTHWAQERCRPHPRWDSSPSHEAVDQESALYAALIFALKFNDLAMVLVATKAFSPSACCRALATSTTMLGTRMPTLPTRGSATDRIGTLRSPPPTPKWC